MGGLAFRRIRPLLEDDDVSGFCSGNSFLRIAPPSPGSVSGVKVSVVVRIIKAQPRLRL